MSSKIIHSYNVYFKYKNKIMLCFLGSEHKNSVRGMPRGREGRDETMRGDRLAELRKDAGLTQRQESKTARIYTVTRKLLDELLNDVSGL